MRLPGIFSAALISVSLSPLVALGQEPALKIDNPRPFGYLVGDLLHQRIILPPGSSGKLPQPGRVDDWLELKEVKANGRDIALTYQLMNAPAEVKTLQLPSLKFGAEGSEVTVPEWPFTVSPVTPQFVLAREGLSEMRPDVPPQEIPTRATELRLLAYALALAALTLWYAYRKFAWRISNRPFSRAYRDLRSLEATDGDAYQRALKIVHRAFDETAGTALFARELPIFLSRHRRFHAAAADVRRFFSLSQQEFFAAKPGDRPTAWVVSLCRSLSRLETK